MVKNIYYFLHTQRPLQMHCRLATEPISALFPTTFLFQCRIGFGQVWLLLLKYKNITLQCGIIISLRHICHCRDCFLQPKKCLQKLREIKSNRWQCLFMLSFTTLRNYCFSKLMNILLNYWLLRQTRLSSSPQQLEKLPVLAFFCLFLLVKAKRILGSRPTFFCMNVLNWCTPYY